MEKEMEIEYSLSEVFAILFKRLWIIVLCVMLVTVGTFAVTRFVIDEKYTATVTMYVSPKNDVSDMYASLNELYYAQEVVNTYIEILMTNDFMNSVVRANKLDYTAKELNEMVVITPVNETEIFRVQVTTYNPQDSLILANTIARLAPKKIIEIRDADAVRVVDPATLPSQPSSPNLLINTAIGFAFGLILGVVIAFILNMMDKHIKNEDDLLKHYDIPILGLVPTIKNNKEAYSGNGSN